MESTAIRLVSLKTVQNWECRDPRTGRDYAKEILRYQIADFSKWKHHDSLETAFARLLEDLKAEKLIDLDAPTPSARRQKKPR